MSDIIDKVILGVLLTALVTFILMFTYVKGRLSKDEQVCDTLGGVYVSGTCFTPESIIDYEGDEE